MRALLCICVLAACATAQAQAPAAAANPGGARAPESLQRDPQPPSRASQRIERVRIEDAGARVDELRYGGQTQTITVQPKADLPEYQVQPGGTRVWNVLKF